MHNIVIRKITPQEIDRLQQIGRQTFSETFSSSNTAENMSRYLEEGFATEKLAAELSDPNATFYFAMADDEVVGYLKLNFGPSQTDIKDDNAVEIERIYVLQAFHGRQVGQLLYEQAICIAKEANADYVWLGVWEKNPRAIRFYEKNGFVPFGKHLFRLGNDEQTDILMKLQLQC